MGTPTMVMIASKCPDLSVSVVDIDSDRIAAWNSNNEEDFPIYEPGLSDLLFGCRGRNLEFTTDIGHAIEECDIIFVCVNTPTKKSGFGAGKASNLAPWEAAGRMISKYSRSNKIVVEKSTVPVRTAEALSSVLNGSCCAHQEEVEEKFVILSNPEFLAEGTAMSDLCHPDRVLIGGPSTEEGRYGIKVLKEIYMRWVSGEKILTSNLWSSELSKLVANALLAQRVSSINSISMLCELTGADIAEVAQAVGSDSRIGNKFLAASVGFGGSCFRKDILNLVYLCEQLGLVQVAEYWSQVVLMNDYRKTCFVQTIVDTMFKTIDGKLLAIFGFAFKKDTSDARDSPAVSICLGLMNEGAHLCIYDPKVLHKTIQNELAEKNSAGSFRCVTTSSEAVQESHAIVILTEWDEFRDLNYREMFSRMQKPAFIFDGRNILNHEALTQIGFRVKAIGKPF